MIRSERLARIIDVINANAIITVDEIVETMGVSPATARRDLDALAERGLLRRTRGGARANEVTFDNPLLQKRGQRQAQKRAIAKRCLEFLEPGCVIGLTGGTTVSAVAQVILEWAVEYAGPVEGHLVTVVTNAIDIAYGLAGTPRIKVVVVGGVVNQHSLELIGPLSQGVLGQLTFDLAFLGVNGFDDNGAGTVDEYESQVNGLMASRATRAVIVADSTKFGRRSFSSVGGVDVLDTIITDDGLSEEWRSALEARGYRLLIAEA